MDERRITQNKRITAVLRESEVGDTINIVEVRRCICESCKELFNNSDIAKTVYREIMNPLEDYLCDKEREYE